MKLGLGWLVPCDCHDESAAEAGEAALAGVDALYVVVGAEGERCVVVAVVVCAGVKLGNGDGANAPSTNKTYSSQPATQVYYIYSRLG